MAAAVQNRLQGSVEIFQADGLDMLYAFPHLLFEGVTSVTLDVSLPRNALVDEFEVQVQARRVDITQVQQVAQLRSYASASGNELVIDFGTPRTVNGIQLPSGAAVLQVQSWLGSQFSPQAAFVGSGDSDVVFAEVRSERLRVLMSRGLNANELDDVRVRLPEPPSGLSIRIDDAAVPAWSHPEPVQPRATVAQPDAAGWDKESRRIVDLRPALAALTGDALAADDAVTFRLTLTTLVPCELALSEASRALRRVRRARFGGGTTTELDFAAEGAVELAVALPTVAAGQTRRVSELRWTAVAELPALRTMPPVGPDAALLDDNGTVLADLLITPDRAACVRLPDDSGLTLLHGVRLPLSAGADGAELRVVLWSADAPGGLPSLPLQQGASTPVTLAANAATGWFSFDFVKPVAIDAAAMPWLAIVATRGSAAWTPAQAGAGAGLDQQVVRRGPPNGPWKALPAALQSAGGVLDVRGRVRLTGLAPKEAPLAPVAIAVAGGASAVDLLPTAKGVAAVLVLAPPLAVAQPVLRIVSRVAGSLVLRDIDVISDI